MPAGAPSSAASARRKSSSRSTPRGWSRPARASPTPSGSSARRNCSLRVGSVAVGDEGRLGARFTIPPELLAYVASGAFTQVYVSRTSDAAYQREVAAAKANKTLPRYTGDTVLTGEITGPVAKAGR